MAAGKHTGLCRVGPGLPSAGWWETQAQKEHGRVNPGAFSIQSREEETEAEGRDTVARPRTI